MTMETLELLAGALAGRRVGLRASSHAVYADGVAMYISDPDGGGELAAAVACQAALLGAGSFDPATMKRLSRSGEQAATRYLGLEVARACRHLADVLPRQISAAVSEYAAQLPLTTSPADSLACALGKGPIPTPPAWFGEMRPRASASTRAPLASELVKDELRLDAPPESDGDGPDAEELASTEMLDRPVGRRSGLRRRMRRRPAGKVADPATDGEEFIAADRRAPRVLPVRGPGVPAGVVAMDGLQVQGRRYPEWDLHKRRYRQAWCTVAHFDPAPAVSVQTTASVDHSLMRALAQIGLRHRLSPRETQGDDLDLTGLIDHRIDVAAGISGVPRIYRTGRRTEPDLGVLLLLDATGSTADMDGETSVFEAQRALAASLTTALDELGQRVATYAFHSRGRNGVHFLHCKGFEEAWSHGAQRRLQSVEPAGFTRLGAAIRHGTHLLVEHAGATRRLMVVIGDGTPYDDGYEGHYAVADARRAVSEAGAFGVACVGVSTTASSGQSIWPPDTQGLAPHPAALAGLVHPLLTGAIQRASHHSSPRSA